MLYLDNAATSYQKPSCLYRAMAHNTKYLSANAGRGGHKYSIAAAEKIAETAEELAELFNIGNSSQIAFTQNATYALNMAIIGLAKDNHVIMTSMEHNSVLRPAAANCRYTIVYADKDGFVAPSDIENVINPDTRLIVCTHVSNVFGSIQPIEEIGKIAKKHNIPFLVDTAQGAGAVDIDVQRCNISMLAFSGHKSLLGPMGTGGLYVDENIKLEPLIRGGTGSQSESLDQPDFMPDMLQSGTLNTPAIASMAESIKFIKKYSVNAILTHERQMAEKFISELKNMDNVTVYGTDNINKRNGTVAFNIGKLDSGEVSDILNNDYGIAVRGGWHCAYLAHKTIGSEKSGAVRASFGFFNNMRDVAKITDAVNKIQKK